MLFYSLLFFICRKNFAKIFCILRYRRYSTDLSI
nr:MAG TPA: hypothetical protein [Caudoviricetes sp.]